MHCTTQPWFDHCSKMNGVHVVCYWQQQSHSSQLALPRQRPPRRHPQHGCGGGGDTGAEVPLHLRGRGVHFTFGRRPPAAGALHVCGTQNTRCAGTPPASFLVAATAGLGTEHTMQRGQLMLASIKDIDVVNILSTAHQPDERGHVERWAGRQRRRFTCSKAQEEFDVFMTAVDKLCSAMSSYAFARPSQRWSIHVFYELLNMMVVCAFKLQSLGGGTAVLRQPASAGSQPLGLSHGSCQKLMWRRREAQRRPTSPASTPRSATGRYPSPTAPPATTDSSRAHGAESHCRQAQAHLKRRKPVRASCTTRCAACDVGLHS